MPPDSANYAGSRGARPTRAGASARHAAARPPSASTAGYLLVTALIALALFLGVWWLFVEAGAEAAWLPAAVSASAVLLVSFAAREVVVRRAWARYTRELEIEMSRGSADGGAAARARREARKGSLRATAASLRAFEQRLAMAEENGARSPEAHLEAYRLCEQYLATANEAMRAPRVAPDARMAFHAGYERVRELQKQHLLAWARGEAQRLTLEAQRRASVSGKIETAQRALEVIAEAAKAYPGEPELTDSAAAVRNFIASVKVAHWVELAERAAFRGRHSRAVARYRDALFYLSRAEIAEDAREQAAERINREIEMLRARIATGDGQNAKRPARRRKKSD